MREFDILIDEALKNGLSPLYVTPMNSQLLYECLGWRVGRAGLEPYKIKTNPLDFPMLYSWPFPQFVCGEKYNLLIVRDAVTNHEELIYLVSNDHQTITLAHVIDWLTYGKGTLVEVADFGEYALMVNGKARVFYNTVTSTWESSGAVATMPLMTTICNFKDQVFGGGVKSSWYDCDETFYCWSKIGQVDFTPDRMNISGYRRCPYGGEVLHTRRLADQVVGYSTKGITGFVPVTDPHATFGTVEMLDIGLLNQGAVNGNLDRQVFLGEDYILREITKQGVKELGYEFYMRQLLEEDEDVIISYDKKGNDFYIGNSVKTFLLSPNGMSELPQHPSTVWRNNNNTYMLPATVDEYEPLITSQPFDFGYAGMKTNFTIESDISNAEGLMATIDYTYDNKVYATAPYKPLNMQGSGLCIGSGNSLRYRLKAESIDETTKISRIIGRYKMNDLRTIRGIHAPGLRGQNAS